MNESSNQPGGDTTRGDDANVRRAWLTVGSIAAVVMLGFGTVQAFGLIAREERTVRQEFPAEDLASVEVSSDDGDVTVVGDADTTVRVVIRLREGWRRVDRRADVEADRLVLSAACPAFSGPFCRATYEVHVPPGVSVVARSDNGDSRVIDVGGGTTAVSDNGDVIGTRLGGRVSLETDNGNVEATELTSERTSGTSSNGDVTLTFDRAPQTVEARSDNGDVEVIVPRGDEMYATDATTDNGDARTPIRTDPAGTRRLIARSDNGDVTIRYP